MIYFSTLFDSNYLSRGLLLYKSLLKSCKQFILYVFAFDQKCYDVLIEMRLENIMVIPLVQFENERLLSIKSNRTRGEYCWTCSSSTIKYVLENFKTDHCIYIDADMYFYNDPSKLTENFNDYSIIIPEHGYSPRYRFLEQNGLYCVQFVGFKNNENGRKALNWWVDACIEWCYNRHEDGKFGDQKYLDDWPERFEKVCVLKVPEGGLAPWNIQQFRVDLQNNNIILSNKEGRHLNFYFYHFHDLKRLSENTVLITGALFFINKKIISCFYKPYIKELNEIELELKNYGLDNKISVSKNNLLKKISNQIRNRFQKEHEKLGKFGLANYYYMLINGLQILFNGNRIKN